MQALDYSKEALDLSAENAKKLNLEIELIHEDALNFSPHFLSVAKKYDIIVSNPPYVRNLEKAEINPNVLEFEPHLALFVEDNDALLFYRKITELAKNHLSENGKLYFEINQYLGKETIELLQALGFQNIDLKKDIYGNDRMIMATLK